MTTTKVATRSQIRLIWDEQLNHAIPRALRELGFDTTYVGADKDGAPNQGSSDAEVIEFAQKTSQIIVTSNHDTIGFCGAATRVRSPGGSKSRRQHRLHRFSQAVLSA